MSVRSKPRMSGALTTHQAPKWARDQETLPPSMRPTCEVGASVKQAHPDMMDAPGSPTTNLQPLHTCPDFTCTYSTCCTHSTSATTPHLQAYLTCAYYTPAPNSPAPSTPAPTSHLHLLHTCTSFPLAPTSHLHHVWVRPARRDRERVVFILELDYSLRV